MQVNRLLIIGLVWPEPSSSAAGTRMLQLINFFIANGFELTFVSAAAKSEFSFDLQQLGVQTQSIVLNSATFNQFVSQLKPDFVMFDRFVMEEQYGWRVEQECPSAIRILDTEDLHCLRHARQLAKKEMDLAAIDLFTDTAKREIASILRCDLSLIISEAEMEILEKQFKIDPVLLHYLPFLEEPITDKVIQNWLPYTEREDLVFIGNFLHEPNWHTVQVLKTEVWPVLSQRLPKVGLHIYGAYPSQKVLQLNNPKERFYVHGRATIARQTIAKHKLLIAPIRFGAGVKGKFIDAMQVGTPSMTTSVGAEAMKGEMPWAGAIEDELEQFIAATVKLYTDENLWRQAQLNGVQLINARYGKAKYEQLFMLALQHLGHNLMAHRQQNFFGQLLQYHTTKSSKYLSLWIEEKNKKF